MGHHAHDYDHRPRLIARIVRSLLATEPFDSLADLTDALKFKLAKARIQWTPDDISSAYAMIASNTPLPGRQLPRRLVEREPETLDLPKADAARLWAALQARARLDHDAIKTISAAPTRPPAENNDAENARRNQLHEQARRLAGRPRRQPFEQRLAEIFGETES